MIIYKVYFPIEDTEPSEVFNEVNLYTGVALIEFANQVIRDEIFGQRTFTEFELDENTEVKSVDQALALLKYDGYLIDIYEFNEPNNQEVI